MFLKSVYYTHCCITSPECFVCKLGVLPVGNNGTHLATITSGLMICTAAQNPYLTTFRHTQQYVTGIPYYFE